MTVPIGIKTPRIDPVTMKSTRDMTSTASGIKRCRSFTIKRRAVAFMWGPPAMKKRWSSLLSASSKSRIC